MNNLQIGELVPQIAVLVASVRDADFTAMCQFAVDDDKPNTSRAFAHTSTRHLGG